MNRLVLPLRLARLPWPSLVAGTLALALCVLGAFLDPPQFFESYLTAYLFFLGVALGSTAMLMVHQLVGGHWGMLIRRFQEAAAASLPLMAILFIPVLLGLRHLYPWADPARIDDPINQYRRPYMATPAFIARAALFFAVWIAIAFLNRRWSDRYERTGEHRYYVRLQRLSAGGLVLYFLTASFAAIDWVMSRDAHWFSSVIGFIFITGQALSGLVVAVLLLLLVIHEEPFAAAASRRDFNDLGNLLLTLVILFAYVSFVQFLIQWFGNTQEDIPFYTQRLHGGWGWVGVLLIGFHFFAPFFILLVRFNKRHVVILGATCVLLLFMRIVDNFWLIIPSGHAPFSMFALHWTVFASLVGIGGVWLTVFLWFLGSRSLLPIRGPAPAKEVP